MHLCCNLVTHGTVFLQRLIDNSLQLMRELQIHTGCRGRDLVQDGIKDRGDAVAGKGALACAHLIKSRAEREKIRARIEWLTQSLLWRHVRQCSYHFPGASEI